MNKYFVNTIYKILAKGIDEGYKTGISSIMKGAASSFAVNPDINYTGNDLEAIRNFKINAFKVAGVGTYELEEELKKLGVSVMDGTIPEYDTFEIAVRQKMLQYGIGLGDQPPSGWIKTNLDHAIKSSISGARWKRVNDPQLSGVYIAWRYETQKDGRVREEHQVLEGAVFRLNDPEGSKIFPPNDWGCRCYETFLTAQEARGLDISTPEKSRELLKEVPSEFRFNPGEKQSIWNKWLNEKLQGMNETEYAKLKKLLNEEFRVK